MKKSSTAKQSAFVTKTIEDIKEHYFFFGQNKEEKFATINKLVAENEEIAKGFMKAKFPAAGTVNEFLSHDERKTSIELANGVELLLVTTKYYGSCSRNPSGSRIHTTYEIKVWGHTLGSSTTGKYTTTAEAKVESKVEALAEYLLRYFNH